MFNFFVCFFQFISDMYVLTLIYSNEATLIILCDSNIEIKYGQGTNCSKMKKIYTNRNFIVQCARLGYKHYNVSFAMQSCNIKYTSCLICNHAILHFPKYVIKVFVYFLWTRKIDILMMICWCFPFVLPMCVVCSLLDYFGVNRNAALSFRHLVGS